MKHTTNREVPEIIYIAAEDLETSDLFHLLHQAEQSRENFVIFQKRREVICVNEIYKDGDLPVLIEKILRTRFLDKCEKDFDKVEEIAGKKAGEALIYIWRDWREEREKAENKQSAEAIIKKARSERLMGKARKNAKLLKACFDVGFGMYEDGTKCDFQKGAEYAFMCGYMAAMQEMKIVQ